MFTIIRSLDDLSCCTSVLKLNTLAASQTFQIFVTQACRCQLQRVNHTQKRFRYGRYGVSSSISPKLSPHQISTILRANEKFYESSKTGSVVKFIDWNQLPSNNPIEDTLAIAQLSDQRSYLLSVFDGHAGPSCARALAKRLLSYIAACLPSQHALNSFIKQMTPSSAYQREVELLYAHQLSQYHASVDHLRDAASNLKSPSSVENIEQAMISAFNALDQQLSEEALACLLGPEMEEILQSVPRWDWKPWWREMQNQPGLRKSLQMTTLPVAMSGAVGCVAYISSTNLVVANTGDCQAVLGYVSEDGSWCARKLSREHTAENVSEVERLYAEHPRSEQDTILRMDRLLGQLMPLRAFGDFRFKWPRHVLEKWVAPLVGDTSVPPHYKTPPYLTAHPEVSHHTLEPRDKFLILASDGLWDMLSPTQVVCLVGEHMSGRVALGPLTLPPGDVSIGQIMDLLLQRRKGLSKRPLDSNAATHLLRHALGSTETGLDQFRLAELLSLPDDVVRLFRDDISIVVIYFDTDYLLKALP